MKTTQNTTNHLARTLEGYAASITDAMSPSPVFPWSIAEGGSTELDTTLIRQLARGLDHAAKCYGAALDGEEVIFDHEDGFQIL